MCNTDLFTKRIRLRDFGDLLVTRDQGEPIRRLLLAALSEFPIVEVDLNDVEAFTPSFVDEVFGKCLEEIGQDHFRRHVRFLPAPNDVRKLVNLVLSNRAARRAIEER